MLGNHAQRSYGVSQEACAEIRDKVVLVDEFHFTNATMSRIQAGPFDLSSLDL